MLKKEVCERFLRYAVIDTQSNEETADKIHPSTEGEWDLLRLLEKELKEFGLKDVVLDKYGYLLARVPASEGIATVKTVANEAADGEKLPCIAFSAHVDTAQEVNGNGVKPRLIENYDGNDIRLNAETVLLASENPELEQYKGSSLVVTDGTTLLGSDDKAGIAEIMTAIHYFIEHTEEKHPEIEILFSPDEETGCGMNFFDPKRLHCQALYTVDGGTRYEIEAECFNAASAFVKFEGVSYHLGSARGRMVNAVNVASAFVSALPQAESPEATDERYGYYCPHNIEGSVNETTLHIVVRDFDYDGLMRRLDVINQMAKTFELIYPGSKITVDAKISYRNMIEAAKKKPKALNAVFDAAKVLNQPVVSKLIRGGTDGARIAETGIPCPNLYTGGHNLHSVYEWAAVDAMSDSVDLICEIIRQWAK